MACNEDLRDGVSFSKLFLDKSESTNKNPRSLMNIHNIEVGRRVIIETELILKINFIEQTNKTTLFSFILIPEVK